MKILIAESYRFSETAARMLRDAGEVVAADLGREGLLREVAGAEVLWVRLRHRVDTEVLEAAPRLRIVATPTTGLNHIDTAEAARRGIRVVSLRGETEFLRGVYATAEHTLALALGLLRGLPFAARHVVDGGWNRDLFRGFELRGKTAGIVGYGRVGSMVGRALRDLGMRVLAADPWVDPRAMEEGVTASSLQELLETADLVSLHASLTSDSLRFFGAAEFGRMRAGAWFLNTARGELVDEGALLAALMAHRIAGAALDVLVDERAAGMGHHPLVEYARTHDNLIITPHIAGCTYESTEKTEQFLARRVAEAMAEERGAAQAKRMATGSCAE